MTTKCLNCGNEFEGNYCPNCGQSAKTGPLKLLPTIKEILPVIYNFDNRLLRTCLQLFTRPGHMIREYIEGHRICYYRPIPLIFLLASIYLLATHFIFGDGAVPNEFYSMGENEETQQFWNRHQALKMIVDNLQSIFANTAWMSLIMITLMLVPCKLMFRRTEFGRTMSYADHFNALVYLQCQSLIISFILCIPIRYLFSYNDTSTPLFLLSFMMMVFSFKQMHNISIRKGVRFGCLFWIISFIIIVVAITLVVLIVIYWLENFSNDDSIIQIINSETND